MRSLQRATRFFLPFLSLLALPATALADPYFTEVQNALGSQPCGPGQGTGCFTNYLTLVDIDNDGKLDILMPNSGAGDQPLVVYKNNGDATFANVSAAAVGGFSSSVRVVAVADVTGDGFADFYAPSAIGQPDKFFINDGTGKFTDEAAARLPGVSSHSGAARFGDVDNDGDMDLLVGDGSNGGKGTIAHLYINDGSGKFAESPSPLPSTAQGNQPYDFDLLDMDGDFDLDLFIDMHNGTGSLWQNDGSGKFTDLPQNVPPQSGLKYGPVACDVDGDGDLDIWQDNSGPSYTEQLMINDGTGKFTDETSQRVSGNIDNADDNGVTCVDIDGDGDFDAVVTALSTVERLLINDGTGHFTYLAGAFPAPKDSSLWADFGDLNGDGKLDLVTGQGESGDFSDRVYIGTGPAVVDTLAPKIRATETLGTITGTDAPVFRFGVSDNATTDTGPRLKKAFLKISAPAAMEVPASFMGGDLFRAVLPKEAGGTMVTFAACATDRQGNEGCSKAISYTVSGSGPGSGGAGGTGGAATGGTGGAATGGAATGGSTGGAGGTGGSAGGAGGAGTTSGTGTGGNFTLDNKGGCGCSVPGTTPETGALALGIAGILAAAGRRRRKTARR